MRFDMLALPFVVAAALVSGGCPDKGEPPGRTLTATRRGAELFKERCSPCHPGGGNTINPRKTLHKGVLADHGILDARDIVKVMRNPGPGMPPFDESALPHADAVLVAEYILATFR